MKNKYSEIQNSSANIDFTTDWQFSKFSHPERTIRLATSFSGIGAIEHSLYRLGLKSQIQFAGDIDKNCKKAYSPTSLIFCQNYVQNCYGNNIRNKKNRID